MQILSKINNPIFLLFLSIFLLHFIFSNFIFDIYSVDRILITFFLSLFILYKTIFDSHTFEKIIFYKNPFILLIIYTVFQAYFSSYINTGFEKNQQLFISLSFFLLFILFVTFKQKNYSLASYLYFCAIISSFYLLSLLVNIILLDQTLNEALFIYFKNDRVFNHLQTIIIPSLGLLLLLSKSNVKKSVILLFILLNFMLLLHTEARGSIYSIMFAFFTIYITNLNSKRVKRNIYFIGITFLLALILYTLFSSTETITQLTKASSGRVLINNIIVPLITDQSFFFNAIGFSSQETAVTHYLHPHNIFLYVFLGGGTIGLIAFILITIYYAKILISEYFETTNRVKRYLLSSLIAISVHSLVSGIYITPLVSLIILYYFLIFQKYYRFTHIAPKESKTLLGINLLFIVTIVCTAPMLLITNMKYLSVYDYKAEDENITKLYHPGIMLYSDLIYDVQKSD